MSLSEHDKTDPADKDLRQQLASLRAEIQSLRAANEHMNKDRVEYLQNVSHQIVSPLNAIKWHIENLTHNRIGIERAKKVLRSIYSQATIAVHLAKNFVFMSNLEADHSLSTLREPLEPVELDRLLVNLADDFQPLGWARAIDIHVDTTTFAKVPDVLAIRPLISQVFSNIIENAVKYSKSNSVVEIQGRFKPSDDAAVVSIRSEGISLPLEDRQRIFERGYRTREATNAYPAGTGFGLYIARKIMDIHEGEIDVESPHPGQVVFQVILYVNKLQGKAREWPKKPSS